MPSGRAGPRLFFRLLLVVIAEQVVEALDCRVGALVDHLHVGVAVAERHELVLSSVKVRQLPLAARKKQLKRVT